MKKTALLLFISLNLILKGSAQIRAVTETGDEVILNKDGTWRYSDAFTNNDSIKTNPKKFEKGINSTFLLKSQKGGLGFWIDPRKWSFKKALANSSGEFELELKGQSLQSTIITEAAEIPLETYVSVALENGKAAAPDLHIITKEYRTVNNLKVLFLQMEGTQAGLKFTYSGYYYSKENATVQFVIYTYRSLMEKYSKDIQELLNGLVVLNSNESASASSTSAMNDEKEAAETFSSNINCKQYFPGSWKFTGIDALDLKSKTFITERTLARTREHAQNSKYYFDYDVKWIDSCSYNLTFRKTNQSNYKLMKVGETINVEITFIDNKVMKYRTSFRGRSQDGEMIKS